MMLLSNFKQQCTLSPNHIAFKEADRQLTYQQTQEKTNQLSYLLTKKNRRIERVAIALDRGIDAAIAILAVLNCSACYIPLDIKNPASRLGFIVKDADVQLIIGKGTCPAWIDNPEQWIDIEQLVPTTQKLFVKTADDSDLLAAILYTSGSTGDPKGVALSHKAMLNFSDWAAETFKVSNKDIIASLTPFYFDLSVFDLFTGLSCGATIVFIPNQLTMSPSRLSHWLNQHHISVWYTVPSILSFMALKGALAETPLAHLRTVLFAGEVFPTPLLIKLCDLLPKVNFYNLYGPTETNVCCYWPADRNQLHADQAIPIGLSACHSQLSIDTESNELLVKSDNNFSGYWQNGQLIPALSSDNFYRTGDKVSINDVGEYCYHGRLDRMLKCSGYRVEPAEIEQQLIQQQGVIHCAVIGIKDNTSGQRPVAMLVLQNNAILADIVKNLRQQLPAYMQPCKFILLESLPYLANGKIDYQSLQTHLVNP